MYYVTQITYWRNAQYTMTPFSRYRMLNVTPGRIKRYNSRFPRVNRTAQTASRWPRTRTHLLSIHQITSRFQHVSLTFFVMYNIHIYIFICVTRLSYVFDTVDLFYDCSRLQEHVSLKTKRNLSLMYQDLKKKKIKTHERDLRIE